MKEMVLKGILVLILSITLNVGTKADTRSLNPKQNVCSKNSAKVEELINEDRDSSKRKESVFFSDYSNCQFFITFFDNTEPVSPINSTFLKSYIRQIYPATSWLDDKLLHILEIL